MPRLEDWKMPRVVRWVLTIVNALGSKKNVFDDSKLSVPFTYVGDCSGERTADIASAIRTGYKAANEI